MWQVGRQRTAPHAALIGPCKLLGWAHNKAKLHSETDRCEITFIPISGSFLAFGDEGPEEVFSLDPI